MNKITISELCWLVIAIVAVIALIWGWDLNGS